VSTKSDDYNCTLHNVTSPLKATNASNIWRNLRSKMKGVSIVDNTNHGIQLKGSRARAPSPFIVSFSLM